MSEPTVSTATGPPKKAKKKILGLPVPVVIGGVAALAAFGYIWWRDRHKSAASASATTSTSAANQAGANAAVVFHNDASPFSQDPQVAGAGSAVAGSSVDLSSGASDATAEPSSVLCQDSVQAGRTNGLVTISSGGLSGPALLSSTPSFQGPLTLPLPHQTSSNANISGTAGSLSAADRTSLNGLINAVNTLQGNLQSAGMEL